MYVIGFGKTCHLHRGEECRWWGATVSKKLHASLIEKAHIIIMYVQKGLILRFKVNIDYLVHSLYLNDSEAVCFASSLAMCNGLCKRYSKHITLPNYIFYLGYCT